MGTTQQEIIGECLKEKIIVYPVYDFKKKRFYLEVNNRGKKKMGEIPYGTDKVQQAKMQNAILDLYNKIYDKVINNVK